MFFEIVVVEERSMFFEIRASSRKDPSKYRGRRVSTTTFVVVVDIVVRLRVFVVQ